MSGVKDRGSLTSPGVELRDLIRGQASKSAQKFDQVALGLVTDTGDDVTVGVAIDGFAGGEVLVTWASPVTPALDQRVVMLALAGGQKFFVVGVVGELIP